MQTEPFLGITLHLLLEIIQIIQYNVAVLQVDYRFLEVIKMKNKHLTFEERIVIEEQLNKGVSVLFFMPFLQKKTPSEHTNRRGLLIQ